jgi:hypothetical protein
VKKPNDKFVEWERVPKVPVTVNEYEPGAGFQSAISPPQVIMAVLFATKGGRRISQTAMPDPVHPIFGIPVNPLVGVIVTVDCITVPTGVEDGN